MMCLAVSIEYTRQTPRHGIWLRLQLLHVCISSRGTKKLDNILDRRQLRMMHQNLYSVSWDLDFDLLSSNPLSELTVGG